MGAVVRIHKLGGRTQMICSRGRLVAWVTDPDHLSCTWVNTSRIGIGAWPRDCMLKRA
jgi:hypothetical protein